MSVYTRVERGELEAFLAHYSLGGLVDFEGISAGIENTNYFVTTEQGEFVLTLFEGLGFEELPYFLELMAYLAEHDIPSAHPMADHQGRYLRSLNDRPATLVQRLPGASIMQPGIEHCRLLGAQLGRLHQVGQQFEQQRDNDRGPRWWMKTAKTVLPRLTTEQAALLRQELDYQVQHRTAELPRGVIHADLFRDNALFAGNRLTGIIDFYYACNDVLLYDLAVVANDWCTTPAGLLEHDKLRALLNAYHGERPLSALERDAWPVMLRAAALRFWLSRLHDLYFPRAGEITHSKDPEVFRYILVGHVNSEGNSTVWV